jgi:hypothetical protein
MTYHSTALNRTLTPGQRDRAVCISSYRQDVGPLLRTPRADGEPCTLRPGHGSLDYGHIGHSRLLPHGACASGVCRLTALTLASSARCEASSCVDGVQGAGEAGIDCGGVCPTPCETSERSSCTSGADCESGSCVSGTCQSSCEDGEQNGAELSVDAAGQGYDATCDVHGAGALCRFEQDCAASLTCEGTASCVMPSDCPINEPLVPCTTDAHCPGGGDCVIQQYQCSVATCFDDAGCPSGVCRLPGGFCACEPGDGGVIGAGGDQCPGDTNVCAISRSTCTDQCVEGRCLGECTLGIGIGIGTGIGR